MNFIAKSLGGSENSRQNVTYTENPWKVWENKYLKGNRIFLNLKINTILRFRKIRTLFYVEKMTRQHLCDHSLKINIYLNFIEK